MIERNKPCFNTECSKVATFDEYCFECYVEEITSGIDPQLKMPNNELTT